MNPTILAALISAGVAGLAGFGAAWTWQGRTIDKMALEARDGIIAQQRGARQAIERATSNVREAQESAEARIAVLGRELAAARQSADGLRNASTTAVRTATESPETCSRIANAYDLILSESRDFIQTLAADADRCDIERQALNEGWPK